MGHNVFEPVSARGEQDTVKGVFEDSHSKFYRFTDACNKEDSEDFKGASETLARKDAKHG